MNTTTLTLTERVREILGADNNLAEASARLVALAWPAGGINHDDRADLLQTAQVLATLAVARP